MSVFSTGGKDLLDSVNFLLAGPTGVGQASSGYWNSTGGYLTTFADPPWITASAPTVPAPFNQYIYTPAYVTVNVTDPTDRVLITSQCRPYISWTATDPATDFNVYIAVERTGVPDVNGIVELAQDNNQFTGNTGDPGNISFGDTIFVGIIDTPGIGRWNYFLDFYMISQAGDAVVDWLYVENLGITATVIKL